MCISAQAKAFAVRAVGSVEGVTDASHAAASTSTSGVYAAVSVVDQDVRSAIEDGASVTAGGDVSVYSDAIAKILTNATAASQK